MSSPKNVHLVKEYIKTFIATDVVFPGTPPRKWGVEFSRSELNAIYSGLKFVIRKAHPLQDRAMISAFEEIHESVPMDLHWFLYDYWREVVFILDLYPDLGDSYPTTYSTKLPYQGWHWYQPA
ncbi:hypothetical protein [Spirosoma foliorum]|uniref:Uncharacterized protein n=1 Tax=Spirosoma foliorum TaxID=2710596 RepID=A0A7G5H090_9BACT|nr:hypothetical protein [Spirosoma foliorum]QMW04532.1 hypothetical protein H3H32_06215 [Spirosoma foliorum]